jgi:ATP-dependent DNA helicase RecQ
LATPQEILQQHFGFSDFKAGQLEIIESALEGLDTLGILSTGAGKSVCYQVPALMREGTCVVICPLIALMKDQVYNLLRKNISAIAVFSGMSNFEIENIYKKFERGTYQFLFISPERAKSILFRDYLEDTKINFIVVDEAHCISEWGYDFRPPYLDIAELREIKNNVPIIALTASATAEVQRDIVQKLQFKKSNTFIGSTARHNISYSCISVEHKINSAIDIIKKVNGSSIVYCRNRGTTQRVSDILNGHGITSLAYHAGLGMDTRTKIQDDWIQNKVQVVCCTNAFGMGIDKPNVRLVVHLDAPDNLEAYYQEAGRAGRDGQKSFAILLYTNLEFNDVQEKILENYPLPATIINVYEQVCDYLHVGFDQHEGDFFDFDVLEFCKQTSNPIVTTLKCLKILEQQEYISLNESVFLPSKVMCIADRNQLEFIEKDYPKLDNVLKTILRLYAGVFNASVKINEEKVAQIAEVPSHIIKPYLQELEKRDIIYYTPAKDKPQIFFIKERYRTVDIHLDLRMLNSLRERYAYRLKEAYHYYKNDSKCCMQVLAKYFSEKLENTCGICNVCINANKKTIDKNLFNTLQLEIENVFESVDKITVAALHKKLNKFKMQDLNTVIHQMLEDDEIMINPNGFLELN